MLFNSLQFLFFLPLVLAAYYALPFRYRWILIFFASCFFYMAFVPRYILILFVIILIDYVSGLAMERTADRPKKMWLLFSLSSNILLLCFFKYFGFINHNAELISSWMGFQFKPLHLDIILPIGLSFHTFQSMSYTIEVYRGRQKAERHLGYFANYVLFFPQMVAGPIERYETLGNELRSKKKINYLNLSNGFKLVLFGLMVKMCIADNAAPFVNQVYEKPLEFSSMEVLAAVFLFSFQIYADFFGYSTIALGCALMLGIRIMDNFKTPYLSRSITEFWTRWHISLSTWFRDYLYIPLGGNKVKLPRWSLNIMIVFMVSGLWHGANWTFVIWGALHGLLRVLEHWFNKLTGFKMKEGWGLLNVFLALKTFVLTSLIWVFFRATNFKNAADIFRAIKNNWSYQTASISFYPAFFFVLLLIAFDLWHYNSRFELRLNRLAWPLRWSIYSVLLFCLMALAGTQKFTFIYFQF